MRKGFNRAIFWFALAFMGQAVMLQLIDAGHHVRYQHYKPLGRILVETHPLLIGLLAFQIVSVFAGLKRIFPEIKVWIIENFKWWQILCVGIVFFVTSATVSRDIDFYIYELFFGAFIQLVNLGNIILIVWCIPEDVMIILKGKIDKLLNGIDINHGRDTKRLKIPPFVIVAAIWVLTFALILNIFIYERHPHLHDEVSYLYQARYFSKGMIAMPVPSVEEAFKIDLMTYEHGRWYSPVPPGWPAVLAIGVLLGMPWVINPILAGINIILSYLLLIELYDRRCARMTILLLCTSPWYIFMGMNFMNHMFTLTCALVAIVMIVYTRRSGNPIWSFIGGGFIGMLSLTRPLEGAVIAGLMGLWVIGIGGKRINGSGILGFIFGTAIIGSLVFLYNYRLTGSPTTFPLMHYFDRYYGPNSNALGFGPDRGMGWAIDPYPGHSPFEAMINADLNAFSINVELFGWSTGSLLLAAIAFFSGSFKKDDYIMLTVILAIFGVYFFYYFSGGPDFSARYWFLMIVPLIVLTVRGMQVLESALNNEKKSLVGRGCYVSVAIFILCVFTLVNFFPWRAIDKCHHYLGMMPGIRQLDKRFKFGRSLILIRGKQFPDYASAAIYNPIDLQADQPVYAFDRNPDVRKKVIEAYPDRPVWIVNGPSITKGGYEVVDGPLTKEEVIAEY